MNCDGAIAIGDRQADSDTRDTAFVHPVAASHPLQLVPGADVCKKAVTATAEPSAPEASEFECSVCFDLLCDPVVGKSKHVSSPMKPARRPARPAAARPSPIGLRTPRLRNSPRAWVQGAAGTTSADTA